MRLYKFWNENGDVKEKEKTTNNEDLFNGA